MSAANWIAYETFKGFSISLGFNTRREAENRLADTLARETGELQRLELREGESIAHSVLWFEWQRGKGMTYERKQESAA